MSGAHATRSSSACLFDCGDGSAIPASSASGSSKIRLMCAWPIRPAPTTAIRAGVVMILSSDGADPRGDRSVADLCDGSQFLRRGRSKTEELQIGRNLFEQHVSANLNLAATRFCRRQEWRDFLLHHDFA